MLISLYQVALILDCHKSTVYGYIKAGIVPKHTAMKIMPESVRRSQHWERDVIESCVDAVKKYKSSKPYSAKTHSKSVRKTSVPLSGYDAAMKLMGGVRA